MTSNADQIAYWNDVAGPKWVAGQRRLDALMAPLTTALLDAAAVRLGEAVLDVGCGCGESALRAAEAAGPRGRVLALDVSAPMLAHARARPPSLAAAPIEWLRADASAHAFAGGHDLVMSRFGVMFFADRPAAFANLRRALKPGGRIAFLTWRRREEVAWMRDPADWLAAPNASAPVEDGGPGPFALGDGEATCRLLAAAGFRDVARTSIDRPLHLGADIEEAVSLLSEHGPAGHIVREADAQRRAEAEAILSDRLRVHLGPGGVSMEAACWLYAARA